MKRKLTSLMLVMLLGLGGIAFAPAYVAADEWSNDNWTEDDYGYYDEDYYWDTDDDGWDSWYGDDDEDWDYYYEDENWEEEEEEWWDWW